MSRRLPLRGRAKLQLSLCDRSAGFCLEPRDVQPDITTTWLGMVGPGVKRAGVDNTTWSDHTDIRPIMLVLLGLDDDYAHEGRALVEELRDFALPSAVRKSNEEGGSLRRLARALKKINSPVGPLGLASLSISTAALESNAPNDVTYSQLENQLISFTNQRDHLAAEMLVLLEGAEFAGQPIDQEQAAELVGEADRLIDQVTEMARNP
jgi:hypothetical protein